jgi:O-antigen/teichoic acid export membrane protein
MFDNPLLLVAILLVLVGGPAFAFWYDANNKEDHAKQRGYSLATLFIALIAIMLCIISPLVIAVLIIPGLESLSSQDMGWTTPIWAITFVLIFFEAVLALDPSSNRQSVAAALTNTRDKAVFFTFLTVIWVGLVWHRDLAPVGVRLISILVSWLLAWAIARTFGSHEFKKALFSKRKRTGDKNQTDVQKGELV